MSEYKQQLSACLDGELSDEEIHRLKPDVEAAEFSTSSRYHLIGAAMRGDLEDADMIDVGHSVRVAVLQEETFGMNKIVTAVTSRRPVAYWWRPVGGMAIAASVALVMVMAVTNEQTPANSVVATKTDAGATSVAVTPVPVVQPVLAARPASEKARSVANLNTYLSEHSESAARDTMQGRLPYARAVSYESK
ncbi:MAG: RseA family anti-sigma factor [Gammaproteobacteria bacterium]